MEFFVGVEVVDSFEQLLDNALDFGYAKLVFCLKEACEVMVHVLKKEESGSPVEVAFVGLGEDDFL